MTRKSNMLKRVEAALKDENVVIAEDTVVTTTGRELREFIVNKGGIAFTFAIGKDVENESEIEDFLEFMQREIAQHNQ